MKATKTTTAVETAKTISIAELANLLTTIGGGQMVNVTTLTNVDMNKTGNPLANCVVRKLQTREYQFGSNYERAVGNHEEKETGERTFEAEGLRYGQWLVVNRIITHNGTNYARFYLVKNALPTILYLVNGAIANKTQLEIIHQFERKKSASKKQSAVGIPEEEQVKPINVKFENIISLKTGGITYTIAE